jgi:beta-glucosidase
MDKRVFPRDFMWGASTASHQVEGGTVNQWTVWELAHAKQLAKTAEDRLGWLPRWNKIKNQATDPENYISGKGVEHFSRYKEDFDIAQKLNLDSLRFSIEWSRIEPTKGEWDEEAVTHYRRYIAELQKRNLEPILNIWHWTSPTWFEEIGGFKKRTNVKYFQRFIQKIRIRSTRRIQCISNSIPSQHCLAIATARCRVQRQHHIVFAFSRLYHSS